MNNRIENILYKEIKKPLKTTFTTSLGSKNVMNSVIVEIVLDDGTSSFGEIPTSFAFKNETVSLIKERLLEARSWLRGTLIDEHEDVSESFRKKYTDSPMTVSGIEIALFRAYLTSRKTTELKYWGRKDTRIETDITIPFSQNKKEIEKWLASAMRQGFKTYKLKISGKIKDDEELLSFVHEALRYKVEDLILRVDGNQGYNKKTFFDMLNYTRRENIEIQLFEQPLAKDDYKGMAYVAKTSDVPIILDETVFLPAQAELVAREKLGHGINIKMAKSGIKGTIGIMKIAQKYGMKLMIGCMTETMTGLSAGIYMAAGTGAFNYVDLDGVHFMKHPKEWQDIRIKGPLFEIKGS